MDTDWVNGSRLFELARQGRRLTHILVLIPLAVVFTFLAQFASIPVLVLVGILYGFSGPSLPLDKMTATEAGFWMAAFLITAFGLVYVFIGIWALLFEKRPFWTLGYERKGALARYGRGFLLGGLMFAAAVGILVLAGVMVPESGDPAKQGAAAIPGVLIILAGWIVQGGAEEILARGWMLPVLGARYRPWVGIAVSSLFFAAMHSFNEGLSGLALANLALFGLFAALYALREGSLWGISALHSAWNWAQGNFFGLEVSGMLAGGTLWNLKAQGPDWLTGGAFGPEGGAAVSAVLVVGILVLVVWRPGGRLAGERTENTERG